jgi:predicted KAP-like P-loop ATPase
MFRSGAAWFEETQLALKEYEKSVERKNKQREEGIEAIVEQRIEANEELRQLEETVQRLEREAQEQEALIPVNQYASLADFVSGRIEAETYKRHLGFMQQVQEDLQALSYKLLPPSHYDPRFKTQIDNLQQAFPRGPARVVVYIDDLDRCPPQRVVEVLEAIQLLVKTPLFIAVIAIDERYMIRALERHYDGMLLKVGSPSCTDYLEKIIQIHYRVRPVSSNILESYLRSQFVLQDLDSAEAENNKLSREEFTMLVNACRVSNLSPRTLKRISNTYKIFKTFCRIRYLQLTPEVQKAIFALLSLSSEYPDLMRDILKQIDFAYEKGKEDKSLQECITDYPLPYSNQYLEHRLEQLKEDAQREFKYGQWKKATILPPNLTLQDMTHDIFNLIRSFSFVGEIGEDPEDYRYSDPVVDEPTATIPAEATAEAPTKAQDSE